MNWLKNPDSDIEQLRRIASTTKQPEDIKNYWIASLRAGILPEPNFRFQEDNIYEKWYACYWILHPEVISGWEGFRPEALDNVDKIPFIKLVENLIPLEAPESRFAQSRQHGRIEQVSLKQGSDFTIQSYYDITQEKTQELIADWLQIIIDNETKFRGNPDSEIEQLRRIAFGTKQSNDIKNYWIAALRAGILPKPNVYRKETDGTWEWNAYYWCLHPDLIEQSSWFTKLNVYLVKLTQYVGGDLPRGQVLKLASNVTNIRDTWNFTFQNANLSDRTSNRLSREEAEELVRQYLQIIIEATTVFERNPDEKIRQRQREGRGSELQAAIEKLRSGIPLEPDEIKSPPPQTIQDFSTSWGDRAIFRIGPRILSLRYADLNYSDESSREIMIKLNVEGAWPWPPLDRGKGKEYRSWTVTSFTRDEQQPNLPVWHYPEVMQLMYEALIAGPERKEEEAPRKMRNPRGSDSSFRTALKLWESQPQDTTNIENLLKVISRSGTVLQLAAPFENLEMPYINLDLFSHDWLQVKQEDKSPTLGSWGLENIEDLENRELVNQAITEFFKDMKIYPQYGWEIMEEQPARLEPEIRYYLHWSVRYRDEAIKQVDFLIDEGGIPPIRIDAGQYDIEHENSVWTYTGQNVIERERLSAPELDYSHHVNLYSRDQLELLLLNQSAKEVKELLKFGIYTFTNSAEAIKRAISNKWIDAEEPEIIKLAIVLNIMEPGTPARERRTGGHFVKEVESPEVYFIYLASVKNALVNNNDVRDIIALGLARINETVSAQTPGEVTILDEIGYLDEHVTRSRRWSNERAWELIMTERVISGLWIPKEKDYLLIPDYLWK